MSVGEIASWGKCQLGEMSVGGQIFLPFFSNFVGGKNSTPFSALNNLRLSEPNTLIKKT